jgi:hypothetical protein
VALKVYIAYGTAADQVTALRLQALGAVNGLVVYVPPAHTRTATPALMDPQSELSLREASVVLGIITSSMSEACGQELNIAKSLGRKTIVMAEPLMAPFLEQHFPGNVLVVDPANPAQAESWIVQFLKKTELEKNAQVALIALGTIALGLLLFAPQD